MSWRSLLFAALLTVCIVASSSQETGLNADWEDDYLEERGTGPNPRRLLASASTLPTCEADIFYNVVELNPPSNFSAVVSITNNREVSMSHWQLVWTYDTFSHVLLSTTDGAIALTAGSPGGAPVRLVDTFTTDGIAPGGGAYAFLTVGQFVPSGLYPDDSLLVNSVNLNGLDCSRVLPDPGLTLGCSQDDDGSSGGTVAQGGCRAVYCCGYVLSTPAALPPATENGGAVPAAPPIAGTPTAPIESTGDTDTGEGSGWQDSPGSAMPLTSHGTLSQALSVNSGATLTLPNLQPSGGSGSVPSALERGPSDAGAAVAELGRLKSADLATQVTLHDQLGSGAFGVVYRAEWNGHPVAVKVLQMTCRTHSSRELDSFKREVEVLSTLKHPHIVSFLAACTVPPNICIIEELATGGSLHARLHGKPGARKRRPLPYHELLGIAAGIADAMVYLHPKVVHRDLKSQNVLLDAEGRALVCDFGIAKFKDRTFVSTANGQAGTPAYMAPEMFDGAGITEKVDVFAFGVLLWEMLTGDVPWSHVPSPMQIIYCVGVMGQRLPLPPACPPVLRALIEACWAETPEQRPSFTTVLAELRGEAAALTSLPAALSDDGGVKALRAKHAAASSGSEASPFASMSNVPFGTSTGLVGEELNVRSRIPSAMVDGGAGA
ncbi:Serine/threonine-protein kinase CTR1 [Auxenochlorella protothecoides]|uniref:Serine/threonine-protein kinase CTR1 n=1 Tax=Auxenochlorella protothecoides TaxID=3075 RepID=A0A087SU48_AUXPR|nr:Serine/threonine-protein kinase CTR1 [Auxenochlorella protothecoides]KFM29252.1 Serine/threonine-protein kinase CTR1 [Auxenochlorella protothecoides]